MREKKCFECRELRDEMRWADDAFRFSILIYISISIPLCLQELEIKAKEEKQMSTLNWAVLCCWRWEFVNIFEVDF